MSYAFTSKNGFCPACTAFGKIWFIKDRLVGGNDYEYCLMSRPETKPTQHKKAIPTEHFETRFNTVV